MVHPLIDDWAPQLSAHLGRPVAELRAHGLALGDFPLNAVVELTFGDQSFARFHYAFVVPWPERQQVAVFTEHCGYHVFPAGDLLIQIRDDVGDP